MLAMSCTTDCATRPTRKTRTHRTRDSTVPTTTTASPPMNARWFHALLFLSQVRRVHVLETRIPGPAKDKQFRLEVTLGDDDETGSIGQQPTVTIHRSWSDFHALRQSILDVEYYYCTHELPTHSQHPACEYCYRFQADCASLENSWSSLESELDLAPPLQAMLEELVALTQSQLKYDDETGPCAGQRTLPLLLAAFFTGECDRC